MSNVDDEIDKILKDCASPDTSIIEIEDNIKYAKQAITTLIEQSERKARIEELKKVKPYLDGKYGKPIQVSGDGQLVLKKALDGFIYVSNRISALKGEQQ